MIQNAWDLKNYIFLPSPIEFRPVTDGRQHHLVPRRFNRGVGGRGLHQGDVDQALLLLLVLLLQLLMVSALIDPYCRMSHLLVDLGLVDLDFCAPPPCPAAQPLLPNSHQPKQSRADSGTLKIQVNKTQSISTWDALYIHCCSSTCSRYFVECFLIFPGLVGRYCS